MLIENNRPVSVLAVSAGRRLFGERRAGGSQPFLVATILAWRGAFGPPGAVLAPELNTQNTEPSVARILRAPMSRAPATEPKTSTVNAPSRRRQQYALSRRLPSPAPAPRQWRRIGVATLSPASIPSFRAVPAATSSTARTGPPEEMIFSDKVSVFSAMRRMRPSLWMKIMSSDT
jgi:hypothetical protein